MTDEPAVTVISAAINSAAFELTVIPAAIGFSALCSDIPCPRCGTTLEYLGPPSGREESGTFYLRCPECSKGHQSKGASSSP